MDFKVNNSLLLPGFFLLNVLRVQPQAGSSLFMSAILVPGDEVLQWNGKSLPGATKKEVYNIILESKAEPQVEIVVSRPIG